MEETTKISKQMVFYYWMAGIGCLSWLNFLRKAIGKDIELFSFEGIFFFICFTAMSILFIVFMRKPAEKVPEAVFYFWMGYIFWIAWIIYLWGSVHGKYGLFTNLGIFIFICLSLASLAFTWLIRHPPKEKEKVEKEVSTE